MNKVQYLIISSSIDFSSDYICLELEKRKQSYLRINRDFFNDYQIIYNLNREEMIINIKDEWYSLENETLKAIYFRAPVFIRAYGKHYSLEEQVSKSQWNAFIRNMVVFSNAKWVNNPVATYKAENKLLQLKYAKGEDLAIPETYVANTFPMKFEKNTYVVKALDTPLFYDEGDELFTYTAVLSRQEMEETNLSIAPVFIQEYISPKIDLRVTVVGNKIFTVKIMRDGQGIDGDWRKTKKEELQYIPCKLPNSLEKKLLNLMGKLKLQFGGIDLIYMKDTYYFIEVNPTGEWGWLLNSAGMRIDIAIVDCMED